MGYLEDISQTDLYKTRMKNFIKKEKIKNEKNTGPPVPWRQAMPYDVVE